MKTVFLAFVQEGLPPEVFEKIVMIKMGILGMPKARLEEDPRTGAIKADLFVGIMDQSSPQLELQVIVRRQIRKPMILFYPGASLSYIQECIEEALSQGGESASVTRVFC